VAQFKFNRDFQIKVLALMVQDYNFLILANSIILPDYFSDEILAWFFCAMRDYYLDYQMRISVDALQNEMLKASYKKKIKESDVGDYVKVFVRLVQPISDQTYIANEVVTFCKHQAITAAILEGPKLLQEEKFEEIESKIREAVSVGVGIMDMGEQYFIGWPERLRRRSQVTTLSTVPTGITELDSYLNGGLHAKQLGLWMGPTSRGKSLALMHCGKRAVIIKKRVAHYTLELSQDEVSTRYDATFSKIPVHDLLDKEYLLAARLDRLGLTWGNTLIVKEYPTKKAGVGTIRAHLLQLASIGFIPDLVIIDYLDLLRPPRYYKEKRDELSAITEEMKGLATEMSFPIWSATQANRSAISMETHTEEQMSEDIGKANISDILITLNQTKEEVDDEIMRLFLAKNRNGPRYRTIKIKTAFDRMSFYEPSGLS